MHEQRGTIKDGLPFRSEIERLL